MALHTHLQAVSPTFGHLSLLPGVDMAGTGEEHLSRLETL